VEVGPRGMQMSMVRAAETLRTAASAANLAELWDAFRAGHSLTCGCGNEAGRIALSVLSSPRSYCFQCVACSWQSGWFRP
jgi:hypothetical protein